MTKSCLFYSPCKNGGGVIVGVIATSSVGGPKNFINYEINLVVLGTCSGRPGLLVADDGGNVIWRVAFNTGK